MGFLADLAVPPGNRLETLKGELAASHFSLDGPYGRHAATIFMGFGAHRAPPKPISVDLQRLFFTIG